MSYLLVIVLTAPPFFSSQHMNNGMRFGVFIIYSNNFYPHMLPLPGIILIKIFYGTIKTIYKYMGLNDKFNNKTEIFQILNIYSLGKL